MYSRICQCVSDRRIFDLSGRIILTFPGLVAVPYLKGENIIFRQVTPYQRFRSCKGNTVFCLEGVSEV